MKKKFNLYIVAWIAFIALFNVIAFVSVGQAGQEKYTASFWVGYALITVMFIGQLICSCMAFKADNLKKLFYNVPIIITSYIGLIVSFIVGGICMFVPSLPYWVGVIICAVVLAANVISVVKSTAAIDEIEHVEEKVKSKTYFIKSLTVEADALVSSAKSEEVKAECRKVYEAIRYSDPMSNEALESIESQIAEKFAGFSKVVKNDDIKQVREFADNISILIKDRNSKCKVLK